MKTGKKYTVITTFLLTTGMLGSQAGAWMMSGPGGPGMRFGGPANSSGSPDFRGHHGPMNYSPFTVETEEDLFVNPERFEQMTGLSWVDENGDGVCDYAQNNEFYRQQLGLQWNDRNNDGINDLFQTRAAYRNLQMNNFVDVDGDGLCDNYEFNPWEDNVTDNFRGGYGPQHYQEFEVDVESEIFVNPSAFEERTGLNWVDENEDGICDYAQNTSHFDELGIGPWADSNNDTIADVVQTRQMYWAFGMSDSFVDVTGNGLCDNYMGIQSTNSTYSQ